MRERIEGIGYYLSCMIFFNAIYALSILHNLEKNNIYSNVEIFTLVTAIVLVIIGIISTVFIISVDDSEKNTIATGKKYEIISIKDLTSENYFANFSVIVLTGIAIPSDPDIFVFLVYILIELALGIVYIEKKMYYMNPILAAIHYSIYECEGKDYTTGKVFEGSYIFLVHKRALKKGMVVKYKNINSKIIKIKNLDI